MRGKYIAITVLAITCGAGAASWRAASQIGLRIQAATHLAAMAQLNAEEKAKAAELALGVSEASERFAQAELSLERKTRQSAEQALDNAINRTAQAVRVLAGQDNVIKNFEGGPPDAGITKEELVLALAAQGTTNKAIESKLTDLDIILHSLDEAIVKQGAARRRAQTRLDNTKVQLQNLSSPLQQASIEAEAKAQALAGGRASVVKARDISANGPKPEQRASHSCVQKQIKKSLPSTKKTQTSWHQSSSLLQGLLD